MSDRPAYKQIADHLRALVERKELLPGASLPSERVLMDSYGAARGTIRQAVALLRSEGLIEVEHGRGSFVRARPPVRRLAHDRFARRHRDRGDAAYLAEMKQEGRSAGVEVLKVGRVACPLGVAHQLQLEDKEAVLMRKRLYTSDGQPMEIATSYIPWQFAEGTSMVKKNPGPGGIYARLEETGHVLKRFVEEVSARMPTPQETAALHLRAGVPVITLLRVAYDVSDVAVEVCDTVMAADRYVLNYELPAK